MTFVPHPSKHKLPRANNFVQLHVKFTHDPGLTVTRIGLNHDQMVWANSNSS